MRLKIYFCILTVFLLIFSSVNKAIAQKIQPVYGLKEISSLVDEKYIPSLYQQKVDLYKKDQAKKFPPFRFNFKNPAKRLVQVDIPDRVETESYQLYLK